MSDRILNLAVRFSDDTVVCRSTKGYDLNRHLADIRVFEGDEAFVREYVEQFAAGWDSAVYPGDYGLVLIDLRDGVVLSMNDYAPFDQVDTANYSHKDYVEDFDMARIRALAEAGRLEVVSVSEEEIPNKVVENPVVLPEVESKPSWEEVETTVVERQDARYRDVEYRIDFSPMTYQAFRFDHEGAAAMQAAVIDAGFDLGDVDWSARFTVAPAL